MTYQSVAVAEWSLTQIRKTAGSISKFVWFTPCNMRLGLLRVLHECWFGTALVTEAAQAAAQYGLRIALFRGSVMGTLLFDHGDEMVLNGTWPRGAPLVAGSNVLQQGPYSGQKVDQSVVQLPADSAF